MTSQLASRTKIRQRRRNDTAGHHARQPTPHLSRQVTAIGLLLAPRRKTGLAKAFGRWWRDTGGMDDPRFVFWHSIEPGGASFGLAGVITEIGPAVFGADFAALQRLRAARSISPLASAIGVSREFLYRVLAGAEWIWPSGRRTRPPGSRLPDTL
jgi:hypothetical protein